IREAILHGVTTGKSQDWMTRQVTRTMAVSHSRAVTIMRTESLRVYREAARQTYEANPDVIRSWTWHAHLDRACCIACVVMDGTEHPCTVTLDGHPRCRCAMVPRTVSWEDLGFTGLADTRPEVRLGASWLADQPASVQIAYMGPAKYAAWKVGTIRLE